MVFSTVPLNPLASDEAGGRGTGSGMIITAVKVTSGPDDHPQLVPMIETSAQNTGTIEGVATFADAGYHSGANLADCDSSGYQVLMPETHDRRRLSPYHKDHFTYQSETDIYLCPQGEVLSYKDTRSSTRTATTSDATEPKARSAAPALPSASAPRASTAVPSG